MIYSNFFFKLQRLYIIEKYLTFKTMLSGALSLIKLIIQHPKHQFCSTFIFHLYLSLSNNFLKQISHSLPVPMNMTAYLCPSSAVTLSTTIRVSKAPVLNSSGPPVSGRTASSMRGRSLMNWRVLSGRSRERFIPILRATLLMHWKYKI